MYNGRRSVGCFSAAHVRRCALERFPSVAAAACGRFRPLVRTPLLVFCPAAVLFVLLFAAFSSSFVFVAFSSSLFPGVALELDVLRALRWLLPAADPGVVEAAADRLLRS